MFNTTARLFALVLLSTGCSVIDVQTTIPEACVTYNNLYIDGTDPGTTTFTQKFVVNDLDSLSNLSEYNATLEFTHAEAHAAEGVPDLGFVQSANFAIESANPDSDLPAMHVFQCDGDCLTSGLIMMPAAAHLDALPYIASGSVMVDLAITGQLPTQPWRIDASVCLSGSAEYKR